MAVTNENSNLMINASASPPKLNDGDRDGRHVQWEFTQGAAAGDANSTIRLFVLRQNERLSPQQMEITHGGLTGRTLNVGHEGYTAPNGTIVAANPSAIATGIDIGTAGTVKVSSGTLAVKSARYPRDTVITLQVIGGTIPAATEIDGSAVKGFPG